LSSRRKSFVTVPFSFAAIMLFFSFTTQLYLKIKAFSIGHPRLGCRRGSSVTTWIVLCPGCTFTTPGRRESAACARGQTCRKCSGLGLGMRPAGPAARPCASALSGGGEIHEHPPPTKRVRVRSMFQPQRRRGHINDSAENRQDCTPPPTRNCGLGSVRLTPARGSQLNG
jgi:hypothetical protein